MRVPSILVFRWVEIPNPERAHAKLLAFRENDDIGTIYIGNAPYHKDLAEHITDYAEDQVLFAAGDLDRATGMTSWKSSGFSFETPEEFREHIEEFIRDHRKDIEDLWAR